jgi:mono/diheme cytochrome c family protein
MVSVVSGLWGLIALAVFAVAMRGGPRGARARTERGEAPAKSRVGQRFLMAGVVLLVAFGLAVPALVLAHNGTSKSGQAVGGVQLTAQERKGRELFAHTCVFCHTLAAVKSFGRVGPNLDTRVGDEISGASVGEAQRNRKALVYNAIVEGRARGKGDMPALLYQGKEAEDVAAFVAAVAGR